MAWTFAYTAQAGPGKSVCQDRVAVHHDNGALAVAVSDGAGSARHSDQGAALAVSSAVELHEKLWQGEWNELLEEIQCRLRQAASEDRVHDLACTLVLVSVRREGLRLLQVGDGGTVVRSGPDLSWLGAANGEYMNVTTFLHEPKAASRALFLETDQAPEALCVFSDGLQHLVIDQHSGQIHAPFFDRVFGAPVQSGHDVRASAWLEQMACSEPVRRRTNDDIGIAVARRLSP